MLSTTNNYDNIKLLYLQSSAHESLVHDLVPQIVMYTSGNTIGSNLHINNYDFILLDMTHTESMEVLENIKDFFPERYVIVCTNDPLCITESLQKGADSILLNPMDQKECERVLYKAASYLNMQNIFHNTHYIDKLTSCSNMYALQEKVDRTEKNALLKVSLHSFKAFQVYYGIQITNKILVEFGNAIKLNLPVNAELYRSCADEFSILIKNPSPSQEDILSSQLKSFFEFTPVEVEGFLLKIQTNIGVSTGSDLIQKADVALAEAKEGSSIAIYDEGSVFIKEQYKHIEWVKVIQEAISDDRIEVYYQPLLDNKTNRISKYEALCRIKGENDEVYLPSEFIQPAIIAGRMCDLTRIIIDKSFKYFKNNDYSFSINITREDFLAEYLADYIAYKCDLYAIDPSRIYIEVLENISTEATNGFLSQIEAFKELGCNISIDDFGMDSSNFSRMMQIEADVVKIDGHFIQSLLIDKNAKIIVENIVDFSRKVGAKTVAEYVDSKELLALVQDLGIDYSQGFYIGQPSPTIII